MSAKLCAHPGCLNPALSKYCSRECAPLGHLTRPASAAITKGILESRGTPPDPKFPHGIRELATHVGVSDTFLARLFKSGILPGVKDARGKVWTSIELGAPIAAANQKRISTSTGPRFK